MQNPEVMKKFLEEINNYKLTKSEKLQLINLRPTSVVELQLVSGLI